VAKRPVATGPGVRCHQTNPDEPRRARPRPHETFALSERASGTKVERESDGENLHESSGVPERAGETSRARVS
jgi:hypothetical protein